MAVFNSICIITDDYPSKRRPTTFVFIEQLVNAFLDLEKDLKISIIAPQSLTKCMIRRIPILPRKQVYNTETNQYIVYRPYSLSFGNGRSFLYRLFRRFNQREVDKCLCEIKPSIIYGHFWPCAFAGYNFAKKNNTPLFVATGESIIRFRADSEKKMDFCKYVSGVICVSSKNKQDSIRFGLTSEEKCIVIPNAVNPIHFNVMDRNKCRNLLGIPHHLFIIIFVGTFYKRKGPKRLSDAIMIAQRKRDVYSMFLGWGEETPTCNNILFKGKVRHEEIPIYLNAADVFVLPTLHEGCCNAIVEALACGLPVISSNLPFNKDILNEQNSVLVNPESSEEIADAIIKLYDDIALRKRLSDGAIDSSFKLSISKRAETIFIFMRERISKTNH